MSLQAKSIPLCMFILICMFILKWLKTAESYWIKQSLLLIINFKTIFFIFSFTEQKQNCNQFLDFSQNKRKRGKQKLAPQQKQGNVFTLQVSSLLLISCCCSKNNNYCLLTLLEGQQGKQKHMVWVTEPQKDTFILPRNRRVWRLYLR